MTMIKIGVAVASVVTLAAVPGVALAAASVVAAPVAPALGIGDLAMGLGKFALRTVFR